MSVKVKICGITGEEALEAAIAAGADFIGLVLFPPSPRHVDMARAAALARAARGRIASVALTVDADDALLRRIAEHVRPDYLQLHGSETPRRVDDISRIVEIPIIKAFRIRNEQDVEAACSFHGKIAFPLFDAWVDEERAQGLPGGTGHAFDWALLSGRAGGAPFMLAGGLTPANVAHAVKMTGAPMVDVSSGVERARGIKDPGLIADFVRAARGAAA